MAHYKVLPHTADLMILVKGESLEELFAWSGESLVSMIVDRRRIRKRYKKETVITGSGIEELLFNFLRWIHFLIYVEDFLVRSISGKLEEEKCVFSAAAWGEDFHEGRHAVKSEVKAVTFHDLRVEKKGKGYYATFVLDV
jgi:SHS2 domain-containing protein